MNTTRNDFGIAQLDNPDVCLAHIIDKSIKPFVICMIHINNNFLRKIWFHSSSVPKVEEFCA